MSSSTFNPQFQNNAVYSLPHLYISGMNISFPVNTAVAIAPGACRDINDNLDMVASLPGYADNPFGVANPPLAVQPSILFQNVQQPLVVSSLVNGANGLDTGTIAASTQYAIYVIGDSRLYKPTAGLLSLTSNVAPILPQGYDSYRLVGFAATDGSSHFVYSTQKPQNLSGATAWYDIPAISVLSGGTATSFTAIDLTTNSAIPTTTLPNIIVDLFVTFTPLAIGDTVQFRPTGSSATANLPTITGIAAGVAQTQYIQVIVGVGSSKPEVDYKVTSGSDSVSVSVYGWIGVSNTAYPALV